MKIGLVLGAGGIQGGAWLTGGLDAIAEETGWDPATADYVIGTSAGSMIGALCASGVPPWFMVAHSRGETFDGVEDAQGRPAATADRAAGARFELARTWPPIGPGSWRLAGRTLVNPRRYTPATVISGWLWRGVFSTESLKETIRRVVPSGWSAHPNLWISACDYETGRRVPFGRADAPPADLADAVAASCAIPGIYQPVTIGGRRFVDGGIYSVSNLDLLRNEGLDLVICLNPTSTLHPIRALNPRDAVAIFLRRASGRRLGSEAKKLRSNGADVVLIQPTGDDLEAMGPNLMRSANRNRVIEVARRTVAEQLREPRNRELLAPLPKGDPERVRRPEGPVSEWPDWREQSPWPSVAG
ncbi:MAG: patatin-like phospholipase family protein [Solirubrobacterales bacterium]